MMLFLVNSAPNRRDTKGIIYSPPQSESARNTVYGESCYFGPLNHASCFSPERNHSIVSSVSGLFRLGSPTTVTRTVRPAIVDSVNRVFLGRALTHVFQKQCKIFPSLTNRDASRTVFVITMVVRVLTSALHSVPAFIHRMPRKAMFNLLSILVRHDHYYNIGEGHCRNV